MLMVLAAARPSGAQDPTLTPRPIDTGHWAYGLFEALYASGDDSAWAVWAEPVPATPLYDRMRNAGARGGGVGGASAVWADLLLVEAGLLPGRWGRLGASAGLEVTEVSVVPERGAFVDLLADVPLSRSVSVWAEGGVSSAGSGARLSTGGVVLRFGATQAMAGRIRASLGQGTTRFLHAGHQSLDGLLVGSARPFVLPGFLRLLGRTTASVFVSPSISTPTTSSAWFSSMSVSIEPHPSITLGAFRTVRFWGEGISDRSLGELVTVFTGAGGADPIDDSQGEIAVRVRFRAWGQALSPYVSLAFEDPPSIVEDPGIVAGVLVPLDLAAGVLTVRYEFHAFGERARWCGSCTSESHRWYNQRSYGPYTLDGVPLGSSLGGYGSRHRIEAAWWAAAPVRLGALAFVEEREELNLLFERWPGKRTGLGGSIAARPRPGWEIEAAGSVAWGSDATRGGMQLGVRLFDLFGTPTGLAR